MTKPSKRERHSTPERGAKPIVLDDNSFTLICEQLAVTGAKYQSCEDLGFNYGTVISTIKAREDAGDDTWRAAWNEAYDKYRESLETAARQRARDGTPTEWKLNRHTGELVPVKIEYSDRLMEVLLKGAFPERFRERIHHSGSVGLEPIDAFSNLTAKAKREIRAIIMRDLEEQREAARVNLAGKMDGGVLVPEQAIADMREMDRSEGA